MKIDQETKLFLEKYRLKKFVESLKLKEKIDGKYISIYIPPKKKISEILTLIKKNLVKIKEISEKQLQDFNFPHSIEYLN